MQIETTSSSSSSFTFSSANHTLPLISSAILAHHYHQLTKAARRSSPPSTPQVCYSFPLYLSSFTMTMGNALVPICPAFAEPDKFFLFRNLFKFFYSLLTLFDSSLCVVFDIGGSSDKGYWCIYVYWGFICWHGVYMYMLVHMYLNFLPCSSN